MIESVNWFAPLVGLAIVALFAFVGCVGDDPVVIANNARDEQQKKDTAAQQAKQQAELYENVVLTEPTLVAYWRLSEGETGNPGAPDSGPQKIDGTYQNTQGVGRDVSGALFIPEKGDKAAQFDGQRGYMEVLYNGFLNPPQDFTIELWIKPDQLPTTSQAVVSSYEVDATGTMLSGIAFDVVPPPAGATDFRARIRVASGTPGAAPASLDLVLGDGLDNDGWFHIVVTYSSVQKEVNVYVNAATGTPRLTAGASAGAPVYLLQNRSAPFRVAAGWSDQPVAAPTVGRFFKGKVDEVALYRSDLDGAAVAHHYLRGTSLPT